MGFFTENTPMPIKQLADEMSIGFFIYEDNAEEKITYVNPAMVEIFGCETEAELLSYVQGSFRGIVHPEDYQRVSRSIACQIDDNDGKYDYVEYRIIRKDGQIRWLVDYGHLVNLSEGAGYFYVFVRDETERIQNHEQQKIVNERVRMYLDALQTLGSVYNYVYRVNRYTKHTLILHGDSEMIGISNALNQGEKTYDLAVEAYINRNVYFDDRKLMIQTLDFSNLTHQLEFRSSVRQSYRIFRNGEIHYYYMKAVRDGTAEDYSHVILSFACEDEDVARDKARKHLHTSVNGKRRILVVEDSEMNREMLRAILEDEYEILEAENGKEGLILLEDNYRNLAAVLLDLQMPVMDGIQFLENIDGDPLLSVVPVIVMTADQNTEERCMELGAVEFLEKPYNATVMRGRIRNMIRIRENAADIDSIEYDELTSLYTREAFNHYASQIMRNNPDKEYTLVVSDIDDFKLVNSIHGEVTGDRVLRHIAETMRRGAWGTKSILARYGADRFIGLYEAGFVPDADRLEIVLAEAMKSSPVENLSIRLGVYANVDKKLKINRICDRAISAMKSIKHSYERHVGTYDSSLAAQHRIEHEMEVTFEETLNRGGFEPWFQPKFDPFTGKIVGAEALVRWRKTDGSMVSPGEFIPLFERDGLIGRLDAYVFRHVCELQARWRNMGLPSIPVSVNMSRTTLYHGDTVAKYKAIAERTGIPVEIVPIEVTESSALLSQQIKELAAKMKEAGFVLHMDDFGSGYSSLTSLAQLPFDMIKIDKSLADNICTEKGRTIISHIIEVVHELGMQVVTEGVETADQDLFLKEQHCDAIQGFFYSKPLPRDVFEALLKKNLKEPQA